MGRNWVPIDRRPLNRRLGVLALASLSWAGFLGFRLVDLQVYQSDQMRQRARRQQERVITLDARRGIIYDRNGRELAMSIEVDSIYAVPAEIDDPARTAAILAPVLGLDRGKRSTARRALARKLTGDRLFVWVRRKIDPVLRTRVAALSLKGIHFVRENRRFYPHGELAAHVLGWVGMDNIGMEGLELALDESIRGRNGRVFALRDARGKKFLNVTRRAAKPGHGVVLTIDETIQHITERELARAMRETGARAGTVVVMDPKTGEILAMANAPTFNPNRPGEYPAGSRRNRAVVDAFEPGSTFKVITLAAALERHLVRPHELIDCQNGSIRVGRSRIRDHKRFGRLSVTEILEKSSNVGAIKVGLRLDPEDFYETMHRFGMGMRTGVMLPGESRGLLRPPKSWSGISQASLSFGQEMSVTALQLATAISAVANGGVLQEPRIILRDSDPRGNVVGQSTDRPTRRVISRATARTLVRMMEGVVREGTGQAARVPDYTVAGKTGTAQKIGPGGSYRHDRHVASFVGFVPSIKPALTILVVLDEPRGRRYHGGDVVAPVFSRIAEPALRYLRVAPAGARPTAPGAPARLVSAATPAGRGRAASRREPLPSPGSVVSGGRILLPDLQGHSLREAVHYLGRIGLLARLAPMGVAADGVVVGQIPQVGSILPQGADITLRAGPAGGAAHGMDGERLHGGGIARRSTR
ncbi:MAG: penicillin-binding transpeptidase domain-containing protein [Acidobacteriota bacterium]